MDPLEGEALMELSPTLSFPAVDRLMGGTGPGIQEKPGIERDRDDDYREGALPGLRLSARSLANVLPLNLSLEASETNPQLLMQRILPSEMVILMTFEVAMEIFRERSRSAFPTPPWSRSPASCR